MKLTQEEQQIIMSLQTLERSMGKPPSQLPFPAIITGKVLPQPSWQPRPYANSFPVPDPFGGPPCLPGDEDTAIVVTVTTDDFPWETSWQITNSADNVIASWQGGNSSPQTTTQITTAVCSTSCYSFTISDTGGDGMSGPPPSSPGSFSVTFNGSLIIEGGGDFGFSQTATNFGAPDCQAGGGGLGGPISDVPPDCTDTN